MKRSRVVSRWFVSGRVHHILRVMRSLVLLGLLVAVNFLQELSEKVD